MSHTTSNGITSKVMFDLAADWAYDNRFEPDHQYISGLPFGFSDEKKYVARNMVVSLLKDAMLVLCDKALATL